MCETYVKESSLIIHLFLINNDFEYSPGDVTTHDTHVSVIPPLYIKEDINVYFSETDSIFIVRRNDEIIFEVNHGVVYNRAPGEITLEEILPFFREYKLKKIFKNV